MYEDNIENIDVCSLPDVDIIVGAIPSQSFSRVSTRSDDQSFSQPFLELLRVVDHKKPRAFMIETTKSIFIQGGGELLENVTELLHNCGYNIKYTTLNPIDYGNVPYNRNLMYIVGFNDKYRIENFEFPHRIKLTSKINDFLDKLNVNEYQLKDYMKRFLLDKLKIKSNMVYHLQRVGQFDSKVYELNYFPRLDSWNNIFINDRNNVRELTVLERFGLSGYYDIKIPEGISKSLLNTYACSCSSVSVVKRIAENIIKTLDYIDSSNEVNINSLNQDVVNIRYRKLKYKLSGNIDEREFKPVTCEKINKSVESIESHNEHIKETCVDLIESTSISSDPNTWINELLTIKPGIEQASLYHDLIYSALVYILEGLLKRPKKETPINEGRKRIDIMFDNIANQGFFYELRSVHNIFCPRIVIECKNYSSTIKNPEIDQLVGRFGKNIGEFGILVCRYTDDKRKLKQLLKDALYTKQVYMIVLCDSDIGQLLSYRKDNNFEGINNLLRDKYDELIL
jgi:DNA (cytosine-5)-methyltransferase 1